MLNQIFVIANDENTAKVVGQFDVDDNQPDYLVKVKALAAPIIETNDDSAQSYTVIDWVRGPIAYYHAFLNYWDDIGNPHLKG